jgi:Protein of unknown function (DUF2911)
MKKVVVGLLFILTLTMIASAQQNHARQDKSQRPSPPAQAQCKFADGKTITVDYSSPRRRDRKIYGGLVPYNQVWRTGANEATTFVTTSDLNVEGKSVPAGAYTLFTVPAKSRWTLIINKETGEWGIPYHYQSEELVRVPMKVSKISAPVEDFTISFDQHRNACRLQITWERTRASIKFSEKK